jgi:hypothetical protein
MSFTLFNHSSGATCGPWNANQFPLYEEASGAKLMGVVAGGGHNLGPHYWLGWTTAFMMAELMGDYDATLAVWGQGLTLVHFSAQPEPFLTENAT